MISLRGRNKINQFRSKSRSAKDKEFWSDAKNAEFYYCHKKDTRRFCRVLKQNLEDKKNRKGSANSVSVANDKSDDCEVCADLLSVSLGTDSLIDSSILDSDCSYHVPRWTVV
jgi:hypothetical protein